jgi:gliding motility-associated-like protein
MFLDTALRIIPILKTSIVSPNAFTPSQESNNRFIIVARGLIRADLYIYNREGLLVYHTTNIEQGWDGRSENGTPCKQGNYVWKLVYRTIDLPSSDRTEIGSVLLIR